MTKTTTTMTKMTTTTRITYDNEDDDDDYDDEDDDDDEDSLHTSLHICATASLHTCTRISWVCVIFMFIWVILVFS